MAAALENPLRRFDAESIKVVFKQYLPADSLDEETMRKIVDSFKNQEIRTPLFGKDVSPGIRTYLVSKITLPEKTTEAVVSCLSKLHMVTLRVSAKQ